MFWMGISPLGVDTNVFSTKHPPPEPPPVQQTVPSCVKESFHTSEVIEPVHPQLYGSPSEKQLPSFLVSRH